MRGYFTQTGYRGLVEGKYMLFASEADYYEFMEGEQLAERARSEE